MAKTSSQGKKNTIELTEEELKTLEFPIESELEIIKAKKGIWLIIEKNQLTTEKDNKSTELEQKITKLLLTNHPKDLVEGKFEKTLSKEELEKFNQMLAENKIEKFKTNPKYIKFVYRYKKEQTLPHYNFGNIEKNPEEYSLEKDGFIATKNTDLVQKLSHELSDKIKNGELKGTRSFTGYYFIINAKLLETTCTKIMQNIQKNRPFTLQEISSKLKIPAILLRIACTFLGEEGTLLEKRKDTFQIIE